MIDLNSIAWWNFIATGADGTKIDIINGLSYLITGHNGAGKSTLLDALCYNWFGSGYRKAKNGQLINSVNKKKMLTETISTIGQKRIKVLRGMKPTKFEIYVTDLGQEFTDDDLIPQDGDAREYQNVLERYIKFDYKSFTQIVLLGSANFKPFMDLPVGDRRTIIENLLDITVFTDMNKILKLKIKEVNADLITYKHETEVAKTVYDAKLELKQERDENSKDVLEKLNANMISLKEGLVGNEEDVIRHQGILDSMNFDDFKIAYDTIVSALVDADKNLASLNARINTNTDTLVQAKTTLIGHSESLIKFQKTLVELSHIIKTFGYEETMPDLVNTHTQEINDIKTRNAVIGSERKQCEDDIEYYSETTICGTCDQDIDEDFKKKKLNKAGEAITLYDDEKVENEARIDVLTKAITHMESVIKAHEETIKDIDSTNLSIASMETNISLVETNINTLESNILNDGVMLKSTTAEVVDYTKKRDDYGYDAKANEHQTVTHNLRHSKTMVNSKKGDIKTVEKNIEDELTKIAEADDDIDSIIDGLKTVMQDKAKKVIEANDTIENYSIVAIALKDDGIKTKIIRHYLPHINQKLNEFLDKFGFPVSFMFDENFNETIRSRYRDEFTYNLFSEGEKARINLALMLTWRNIAMMKNRNALNLLIFDEVFDGSMDSDGGTAFMDIIEQTKAKGSVVVISHDEDTKNAVGFDRMIDVMKDNNFSQYKIN